MSCISKNNMPHCHLSLGLSVCPGDRQRPGRQFQWAEHSAVVGSVYYAKSLFLTSFHIIITSVAFLSLTFSIDQRTQLKSNTLFMWVWPPPVIGLFFFPLSFPSLSPSPSCCPHSVFQYYCLLNMVAKFSALSFCLFLFCFALYRIDTPFTEVIRKFFTSHYVWKILW